MFRFLTAALLAGGLLIAGGVPRAEAAHWWGYRYRAPGYYYRAPVYHYRWHGYGYPRYWGYYSHPRYGTYYGYRW